jgi:hypothetical protein
MKYNEWSFALKSLKSSVYHFIKAIGTHSNYRMDNSTNVFVLLSLRSIRAEIKGRNEAP